MADPVLTTGQYSIGTEGSSSAFVYGGRQPTFAGGIQIARTEIDPGSAAVQDQAVVGRDGQLFGIDTMPGLTITQTGQANAPAPACLDDFDALSSAWNADAFRFVNGAVQCLRAFYPGSTVVRRVYGRGRKIAPTMGGVFAGIVPFVALFQAADLNFYSDTLSTCVMKLIPSLIGGITPPVTPPYVFGYAPSQQNNTAVVTGRNFTWPVITFTGPVAYPGLLYVNSPLSISYNGVLKNGDTLVIDTRPWAGTALLNNANVAGLLLGSTMNVMQLPSGSTLLRFTGTDYTGQATCTVAWRNAWRAIGGSIS